MNAMNKKLLRKRLRTIIDMTLNYPLISVQAGSGCGKTQMFDVYFQETGKDVIWMKMNRMDNYPEHFWKTFIQAVSQKNKAVVFKLLQIGFPTTPADFERVKSLLIQYICSEEGTYFLLDDFHMIKEPAILQLIHDLTMAGIRNNHVILISADRCYMDLTYFKKKQQLGMITESDLLFTASEIRENAAEYNLSLTNSEIHKIYQFTEGWALAINLILMSIQTTGTFTDYKTEILPAVFELMEQEVFSSYPLEIKKALVTGSIIKFYPVDLVAELINFPRENIIKFCQRNTFLRYNKSSDSLSIHYMYLEFLKTRQSLLSTEEIPALLSKAASWYEGHEYFIEAIDCYQAAGSYAPAWTIIKSMHTQGLSGSAAEYLISAIHKIPADIAADYPEAPIYEAFFLLNNMELDKAINLLNKAKTMYRDAQHPEWTGELNLLIGLIHYHKKEPAFSHYFIQAEQLLPKGSQIFDKRYPLIDLNRAFSFKDLSPAGIDEMANAYLTGFPSFVKATHGCGSGLAELAMAELNYYKTDLEQSESYALKAIDISSKNSQLNITLNSYFLIIRIHIARGNYEKVINYVDKMEDFHEQILSSKSQYSFLDIGLSWFYLKMDKKAQVARWIIDDELNWNLIPPMSAGSNHTIHAHWMLLNETPPKEIITYLEQVEQVFLKQERFLSLIHIYLIKAFAHIMLDDTSGFVHNFEKSYEIVTAGDLDMYYIELGESTLALFDIFETIHYDKLPEEWCTRIKKETLSYTKHINKLKEIYRQKDDDTA